MKFASLGSGSRGNSVLVQAGSTSIMVDCGFSVRETERRLARLNYEPEKLDAILVTHEHGDHIQGVAALARKYSVPVWSTLGTRKSGKLEKLDTVHRIDSHTAFSIGDVEIHPFPVPHDANEPCQFVFTAGDFRLGLLTDTGSVTPHIVNMLSGLDALLIECNHDFDMLQQGSYSPALKQRVGGDYGHMSNAQAVSLLKQLDTSRLQYLVAMHLSGENNSVDAVYDALGPLFPWNPGLIEIADQLEGLGWRCVEPALSEI